MIMDGCKNITTILNPLCVDRKDIGKNFTAQVQEKKKNFASMRYKRRNEIY